MQATLHELPKAKLSSDRSLTCLSAKKGLRAKAPYSGRGIDRLVGMRNEGGGATEHVTNLTLPH